MNYPEPWQMETEADDALEVVVDGARVAWTLGDDVYVHTGDTTQREDGYVHIGTMVWEDTPDPFKDMDHNVSRLNAFVRAWQQAQKQK